MQTKTTMLYENVETGERVEFYKMGGFHFTIDHKYIHAKELRYLWKFVGYLRGIDQRKFRGEYREPMTVRRLQCETTTTINGFKIRKYKMKRVEI